MRSRSRPISPTSSRSSVIARALSLAAVDDHGIKLARARARPRSGASRSACAAARRRATARTCARPRRAARRTSTRAGRRVTGARSRARSRRRHRPGPRPRVVGRSDHVAHEHVDAGLRRAVREVLEPRAPRRRRPGPRRDGRPDAIHGGTTPRPRRRTSCAPPVTATIATSWPRSSSACAVTRPTRPRRPR